MQKKKNGLYLILKIWSQKFGLSSFHFCSVYFTERLVLHVYGYSLDFLVHWHELYLYKMSKFWTGPNSHLLSTIKINVAKIVLVSVNDRIEVIVGRRY